MNKIKSVLFDLGNVIAYIDFDAFWRSLGFISHEATIPFKEGYRLWTKKYETGLISTSKYLEELESVFNHRFGTKQIEEAFAQIMLEPIDEMYEIVKKISDTHQTALVSNTNDIHYNLSLKRYKALELMSKHYLSYKLRVMKPAKEFYEAIIEDQKCHASELLLIDDLETNVAGAIACGMRGIKFETPNQLKNLLKDFKVLL